MVGDGELQNGRGVCGIKLMLNSDRFSCAFTSYRPVAHLKTEDIGWVFALSFMPAGDYQQESTLRAQLQGKLVRRKRESKLWQVVRRKRESKLVCPPPALSAPRRCRVDLSRSFRHHLKKTFLFSRQH